MFNGGFAFAADRRLPGPGLGPNDPAHTISAQLTAEFRYFR